VFATFFHLRFLVISLYTLRHAAMPLPFFSAATPRCHTIADRYYVIFFMITLLYFLRRHIDAIFAMPFMLDVLRQRR